MKITLARILVAAIIVAATLYGGTGHAAPAPEAGAGALRSEVSDRIDAFVAERMAARGIPGVAVAVVRGGETVHLAGYGRADATGRAVTPDTPFLLGSVSKVFTAAAVFQLVEEGALSLDAPILPYLAAITGQAPAGYEGVTVEHLVTHTSGLPMSLGLAGTERIHRGPEALERRVADLVGRRPGGTPGERFEYSNANYILLAAVIQQATGRDFADHLRDRVFAPLDMDRTFASDREPAATDLATGHQSWFGRWRSASSSYDPAGAAMGYTGSTARDLARLLHAHLGGEGAEVLPLPAAEVSRGPIVPTGWSVPLESGVNQGWFVDEIAGHPVVSHAGSLGDFTVHLVLVPGADGLGVAVLTNASAVVAAGHAGQYDISLGLTHLMLGLEPEPADPNAAMSLVFPAAAWAAALLVLLGAVRDVTIVLPRSHPAGVARRLRPVLLPALGYLSVATTILIAVPALAGFPMSAARLFYPDVGWGLTVTGYLALTWAFVRTAFAIRAVRRGGRSGTATPASA